MAKRKKPTAERMLKGVMYSKGIKLVKEPLVQQPWRPFGLRIDGIVHKGRPTDERIAGLTVCYILWSIFDFDLEKRHRTARRVVDAPNCFECLAEEPP